MIAYKIRSKIKTCDEGSIQGKGVLHDVGSCSTRLRKGVLQDDGRWQTRLVKNRRTAGGGKMAEASV